MNFGIIIDGLTLICASQVVSISKKDRFVDFFDIEMVNGTIYHVPDTTAEPLIEHFGFKLDDFCN